MEESTQRRQEGEGVTTPYERFLESKAVSAPERGYIGNLSLNPDLKPHARDIAAWMIRGGNRACFASFGLHKTSIQLQICESLLEAHPEGAALIVCPLGVRREFMKEQKLRGFETVPVYIRNNAEYEQWRADGHRLFLTNYERIRDGDLDPNLFTICTLDEAAVLRSFGSKTYQTFLPKFDRVLFKFVATATPSPNRYKELIHYAGFLGIMDTGQALTRFFKRDSSQAGNLTIHPHKEREFWLWVSTWATFITKPSDLGYSDEGYDLPPLDIIRHRLPVDYATAGFDSWGQGKLIRNAATSLSDAAREKRDSLAARVQKCKEICEAHPDDNIVIWCELEAERRAVQKAIPEVESIWGSQDIDDREEIVERFADGQLKRFSTKFSLSGSGSNFQEHCHVNICLGLSYKFADFIQGVHRTRRFGQKFIVQLHLIYTESEDPIHDTLMQKWKDHDKLHETMAHIIQEFGLNQAKASAEMRRSIGITRQEAKGDLYTTVNNDNVMELLGLECVDRKAWASEQRLTAAAALDGATLKPFNPSSVRQTRDKIADNSVDLIVTSWPFSDHYEYTESYNDFGHNDGDRGFFEQMDFLTPELIRVLGPGRMYCVHAKDRIVYGSVSGDGMYTVNPFSDKCVAHCIRHGLRYCGRITVATDVVRENNQTYRLGYSENAKDGTKMGVGSPEYVLLFRKLPTDHSKAYADRPVPKPKEDYTRARWQLDAHSFWRSSGNRFLTPDEIGTMPMDDLRTLWHQFSKAKVYDYGEHVRISEEMEKRGILPASFMALDPPNPGSQWIWDDVARMRTLNTNQGRKGWEQHVCPLQLDIVERLIERFCAKGELVLDPFAGLGTVPYCAVAMGRRGYGIELNEAYYRDSVYYCHSAELKVTSPTLFDLYDEGKRPLEHED
jgi:DNA modification methylase